jgi:hypothetical protein
VFFTSLRRGVDLTKRTIIVGRLKGSNDSTHYLERDELAGLRSLQRSYAANGISPAYVFVNERGQPFGRMGIARMIERAGDMVAPTLGPYGGGADPRGGARFARRPDDRRLRTARAQYGGTLHL